MHRKNLESLAGLARQYVGRSKYCLRASLDLAPDIIDCSSFTQWLYAQIGLSIPRLSFQQFESCRSLVLPSEAQIGQLMFRRSFYSRSNLCPLLVVGHVGLYVGNGNIVHASFRSKTVVEESIKNFFNVYETGVVCAGSPTENVVTETDSTFSLVHKRNRN